MKVVTVDMYDREGYEDELLAENLTEIEAEKLADAFNNDLKRPHDRYAIVTADDYPLYKI